MFAAAGIIQTIHGQRPPAITITRVATFLLKTEPSEYSFEDLQSDGHAVWDGISNPAALKCLRETASGDQALIYHTGDVKAIVGLATIVKAAYPDPNESDARLVVIEIKPLKRAKSPLTLAQVKADPRFKDFALVRQSRLSVMRVPPELDEVIRTHTGL